MPFGYRLDSSVKVDVLNVSSRSPSLSKSLYSMAVAYDSSCVAHLAFEIAENCCGDPAGGTGVFLPVIILTISSIGFIGVVGEPNTHSAESKSHVPLFWMQTCCAVCVVCVDSCLFTQDFDTSSQIKPLDSSFRHD